MPSAGNAASWLCVSEMGSGIVGVPGNYESIPFDGGDNFLIRRPLEGEELNLDEDGDLPSYVVIKVGEGGPVAQIYADIVEDDNFVVSKIGRAEFAFNAKLRKFFLVSYYSYLTETEGGYTPFMLVGNCTRLD